jgi:hypothetical protein
VLPPAVWLPLAGSLHPFTCAHTPEPPTLQGIKTVLYPKAPLLDAATGRLTTPCVKALLRIFLMCDHDGVRQRGDVASSTLLT